MTVFSRAIQEQYAVLTLGIGMPSAAPGRMTGSSQFVVFMKPSFAGRMKRSLGTP